MAKWLTRKTIGAICLGVSLAAAAPSAIAVEDVLVKPARDTDLATQNLLNDAVDLGERIVAVGERGHIVYSDDRGETWSQAEVPVSVTLTAVDFGTPRHGWAVGHSGAVLHSSDAGETWQLQLDGVEAARIAIAAKEERAVALEEQIEDAPVEDKGDLEWALDDLMFSLENLESDLEVGPVNPMLSVWFENDSHGFVMGAYGMIFRTRDGGDTWQDWSGELANPQGFHLNAMTALKGGGLVIVGEAGFITVSDDNGDTWELRESPYPGSLFGVLDTDNPDEMMVFGLRGNLLISSDLGERWQTIASNSTATLNAGAFTDSGGVILVGNGGAVVSRASDKHPFETYFRSDRDGLTSLVLVGPERLLLLGENGVVHTNAAGKNF
ncbi:MAG: photosystem I reaction center subunit IV [Oleiphilaceae bacterium]|nr:photosystem I reaction center subunit IV [Oleiphilaceae bacterium]